jgi:hypothetical protein
MSSDDGLRAIVRRDLERIEVPDESRWVPTTRPRVNNRLVPVLATVVAVLAALAIGRGISDLRSALGSNTAAAPGASASPSASVSAEPQRSPAASGGGVVTWPANLTILAVTDLGNVYRLSPSGQSALFASPCSTATASKLVVSPDGASAVVVCGTDGTAPLLLLDLRTGSARQLPARGVDVAWSPDGQSLGVLGQASCAPAACENVSVYDVATGSLRQVLANQPMTRGVAWTSLGLSVYQAQPHGNAGTGTIVWNGSQWNALSPHALVSALADGRALLVDETPVQLSGSLWARDVAGRETRLSPNDGEYPLALLTDGRAVAWRPDGPSGAYVVYDRQGSELAHGPAAGVCQRSAVSGAWVVCAAGGRAQALDTSTGNVADWPGVLGERVIDVAVAPS